MRFTPNQTATDSEITFAKALYDQRRRRAGYFPALDLAEPSWDLLLHLFINQRSTLTTGEVCRGTTAPRTTALRYIDELTAADLLVRERSERDIRKIFVALSDAGMKAMRAYLADLAPQPKPQ